MSDFMKPIRPTGHGYRLFSYFFFVMALGAVLFALSSPRAVGSDLLLFGASWLVVLGILMRVVSDFLAGLNDIARAIRERR